MLKITKQRGFSLLEILIAFSILAVSLGILLNIFSAGVTTASVADDYTTAVQIAESLMAKTGIETPLQAGESAGNASDKYRWHIQIQPIDFNPNQADIRALPAQLFKIKVNVNWDDDGLHNREVTLVTLKVVNKIL